MERLAIQSDIANMPQIEAFISNVCDSHNLHNYFATIAMAVLNAVENAMVHGNACNPEKWVCVEFDTCRGGVAFSVKDEGQGFDWQQYGALPDADKAGSGIFMMRLLANEVEYSEGGSCVRMVFAINGIEDELALRRSHVLQHFYAKNRVEA